MADDNDDGAKDSLDDTKASYWFYIISGVLGVLGIGLIFAAEKLSHLTSLESRLCLSLGESILIASILALTVDSFLKQRLAREVARGVYHDAIFRNCPDWYAASMEQSLRPGLVSDSSDWTISIKPHEASEFVCLQVSARSAGTNLSAERVVITPNWLLASVEGAPQSTFTYFRLVTDDRVTITIEEPEFKDPKIQEIKDNGQARIAVGESKNAHVPPNAHYELEVAATIYMGKEDVFPMINSRASHATRFVVNHSAMPDGRFGLQYHSGEFEPDDDSDHDHGVTRYHLPGVAHPGSTVLFILGSIARQPGAGGSGEAADGV